MQIINVIVRHYARNKNDTYRIFLKEPIHFPDFASSFLVHSVQQCWEYNLVSLAVEMVPYDTELWVFIVKAI